MINRLKRYWHELIYNAPWKRDYRIRYGQDEVVHHHWGQYLVIISLALVAVLIAFALFGGPLHQFSQAPLFVPTPTP